MRALTRLNKFGNLGSLMSKYASSIPLLGISAVSSPLTMHSVDLAMSKKIFIPTTLK